jgi:hypothetical protein
MNYNAVISSLDISDESGTITEPVTLQEMKDYLRLEGYVDMDESTSDNLSDFTGDDDLISDLITTARELIEEKAGISVVAKTWETVLTNLCGMIEIPYGPVQSITSLADDQGNDIPSTSYVIVGNKWKYLKCPELKNMTITYTAGFDVLPKPIKIGIMRVVAYLYEYRGDEEGAGKMAYSLSCKYSRNTVII